jgi:hypothetical protein
MHGMNNIKKKKVESFLFAAGQIPSHRMDTGRSHPAISAAEARGW